MGHTRCHLQSQCKQRPRICYYQGVLSLQLTTLYNRSICVEFHNYLYSRFHALAGRFYVIVRFIGGVPRCALLLQISIVGRLDLLQEPALVYQSQRRHACHAQTSYDDCTCRHCRPVPTMGSVDIDKRVNQTHRGIKKTRPLTLQLVDLPSRTVTNTYMNTFATSQT
jgi:hypothetical protein